MIFIKLKMLLISFFLLCAGSLSYASIASTKSTIFTITSSSTLERQVERFLNYGVESNDGASLKNIVFLYLQKTNEIKSNEIRTQESELSEVKLRDTYISFGNISAMLTDLAYVGFSQLAKSTVDIIIKVQEDSIQQNLQINSTIETEKMTLTGYVTPLGSKYQFTINLTRPTFRLNKNISETFSNTTTFQTETFTFDRMTTDLQPKDYNSFLIRRSGLNDSILQRMADSWLPPIFELLKRNSNLNKIRDYEKKLLKIDDKNLFNYWICHWIQQQSNFSVQGVSITDTSRNVVITDILINDIGSYETCNSDIFIDKKRNINFISLELQYSFTGHGLLVSLNQTQYFPTAPPPEEYTTEYYLDVTATPNEPIIRECGPIEFLHVIVKIEFGMENETNKVSAIRGASITNFVPLPSSVGHFVCLDSIGLKKPVLNFLQTKLTEYLAALLLE